MALFCIFVSIRRHPEKVALFARFSSARRALYTVPVQFRDMFRGKVGLRHGVAMPEPPDL
ncbi:hypothetical protein DQ397_004277 [Pseudomonas sp. CK-NBRI-02]|uniref:Uncharacterized protein n=1 Tax=Pseudomonas guariconensis TaxID=1288410 RepID=A0AAX0VWH0_9PSED|nr:hypothetical protein HMPREF3173_17965 [Pseudomonas sp. HMSC08G10]PLV18837.1 hypothetical protein CXG49_12915 [Pseudomonas guariconensis]PLV23690.1 hypothetical protein CXG53_12700 [Pseudomonas guariconensis]PLV28713.1 hypothetical protein CXG51_13170 [Pseudomonas guariconensis]TYO70025.1 hypothetical protein DQ397_004277 [Pseudomonas sp. CK-NBRI-02]